MRSLPCFPPLNFCVCHAGTLVGNLAVIRKSTGALLGYMRKTFDGQNSYTYGTCANALQVSFDPTTSPFPIKALNGPDSAHPYVGAVGGSGGYNFNTGSVGYTYFSGTGLTPANSPPSSSAGHSIQALGYNAPAESTIWILTGNVLSSQWVNTDGSVRSAVFFYDAGVDFLGQNGDLAKFSQTFPGEGAFEVTINYVPTCP